MGPVTSLRKPVKRPTPRLWASWKPFGIGEQRPNNYLEIVRAAWENRGRLGYAWRILRHGVCDGCALGTRGLRDWTLEGVHLCNVRLRLLRLNTQPALDPAVLADASALAERSSRDLRALGRLPAPLLRRAGEPGFTPIGWEAAYDLMARRIAATTPDRLAFYLTSRGMPNESYYAAQKAARALGTNSIDNAARVCHSPSTSALKQALGVSATTCSYRDWIGTDLVVLIGANVANNQPVATKYLHYARKAGTRVVVVNTFREPGLERYWVPSVAESALFGTRLADRFFLVDTGGDAAFLSGVLKAVIAAGAVDGDFVERHTTGFGELVLGEWGDLERASGSTRAEMEALAAMLGQARRGVLVWSMGVTQHECGEDTVRAIVNLALARGFLGREGCGLMPIRGHSGVQGGAEMGAYSTALPGGVPIDAGQRARFAELWGFKVPAEPGLTAPEMIDAAAAGRLDVLFSAGGNFLEVMPDPGAVRAALARVPLRVHMDLVPSSQMLVAGEEVLLLPAATRYEIAGGVTETTTERRVIFSPQISQGARGPRVAAAKPEFEVLGELAARVRPEVAGAVRFASSAAIREEVARVIPAYDGIQRLAREGDSFQYGGPHLCPDGVCPTPDGRARFAAVPIAAPAAAGPGLRLSTRRGKQFNSMVQADRDSLTGAARDDVLVSPADARRLGLGEGVAVIVRSPTGELRGRLRLAPVKPGNVQVHWPEGNVLVAAGVRSPQAGIPDYNALVTIEGC
jgi:molybdopterin-dependent oxidoreductase alpha subunit